jgi:hypothetical protein
MQILEQHHAVRLCATRTARDTSPTRTRVAHCPHPSRSLLRPSTHRGKAPPSLRPEKISPRRCHTNRTVAINGGTESIAVAATAPATEPASQGTAGDRPSLDFAAQIRPSPTRPAPPRRPVPPVRTPPPACNETFLFSSRAPDPPYRHPPATAADTSPTKAAPRHAPPTVLLPPSSHHLHLEPLPISHLATNLPGRSPTLMTRKRRRHAAAAA